MTALCGGRYDGLVMTSEAERFLSEEIPKVFENFEVRPAQLEMLRACAQVIEEGGTLLVEAPTGVGKTLAYLIPIILSGRRAHVSTRTINLQEQLMSKDLPQLARLVGANGRSPLRYAIAKGYSHYLCKLRWGQCAQSSNFFDQREYERLSPWVEKTETGDLEELDWQPRLWSEIAADPDHCLRKHCRFFTDCFYFKGRDLWEKAQILVANHALLGVDALVRAESDSEEELLPAAEVLVIDEGHRLDEAFSQALQARLTQGGLQRALQRLIAESRGARASAGLLWNPFFANESQLALDQVRKLGLFGGQFFAQLRARYPEPSRLRMKPADFPLCAELEGLAGELTSAHEALTELYAMHPLKKDADDQERDLLGQLQRARAGLQAMAVAAVSFLQASETLVQWVEISGQRAALVVAPLYPADLVKRSVLPAYRSIILTSATLTVGGDFSYVTQKLGLEGRTLKLSSSFDYARQARLKVGRLIPERQNSPEYLETLTNQIERALRQSEGGALVLFTSWALLHNVQERLAERITYKLLVQGEAPRSQLIETFMRDGNAVLLGVSSFWEGVDLPGAALRTLIITRLPFEVPDDPLHQARLEAIARRGGEPFWEYSLPQAVLAFRQGFGRLIRTKDDYGTVIVLDGRLWQKAYGRLFLESLPEGLPVEPFEEPEEII